MYPLRGCSESARCTCTCTGPTTNCTRVHPSHMCVRVRTHARTVRRYGFQMWAGMPLTVQGRASAAPDLTKYFEAQVHMPPCAHVYTCTPIRTLAHACMCLHVLLCAHKSARTMQHTVPNCIAAHCTAHMCIPAQRVRVYRTHACKGRHACMLLGLRARAYRCARTRTRATHTLHARHMPGCAAQRCAAHARLPTRTSARTHARMRQLEDFARIDGMMKMMVSKLDPVCCPGQHKFWIHFVMHAAIHECRFLCDDVPSIFVVDIRAIGQRNCMASLNHNLPD